MSNDGEPSAENVKAPPVPEPGTRFRKVVVKNVAVRNYFECSVQFDKYVLHIRWEEQSASRVLMAAYAAPEQKSQDVPMFSNLRYFQRYFPPFEVEVSMKVLDAEGQQLYRDLFELHNKYIEDCVSATPFANQTVDVIFEFRKLEGLGIKPLRDYAVGDSSSDVVIIVENQRFHLNKSFLIRHSDYFERLLLGDFAEKNQKEITLKEVSATAFENLLDILHHDIHPIHKKDDLLAVLSLADQWNFEAVFSRIQMSWLICPMPFAIEEYEKLWIYDKYRMPALLAKCIEEWKPSNAFDFPETMFSELSETTKFALVRRFADSHSL